MRSIAGKNVDTKQRAKNMEEEKDRAKATGQGCYDGIKSQFEMIDNSIEAKDDKQTESLEEELDGFSYGVSVEKHFVITLAGGGPACRIYGDLDEDNEPYNAQLQYQDWGTQWTRLEGVDEELLNRFAQRFYFGEK